MLTLTWIYRFLRFDAEGFLLSEYAEMNRLLVWTHIITPGSGGGPGRDRLGKWKRGRQPHGAGGGGEEGELGGKTTVMGKSS